MSEIKKGDRVRVVVEGTVERVSPRGSLVIGDQFTNVLNEAAEHVVSVEVIEPAEPEYIADRIYQDTNDKLYQRRLSYAGDAAWLELGTGYFRSHAVPTRPLVEMKLVATDGDHLKPGDVITAEPPVGSRLKDKDGDTWQRRADGWEFRGSSDRDVSGREMYTWSSMSGPARYAPLTLVRWGAGA